MNHPGQTPKEIAKLIEDIIQDKVVCDIGCGTGDFMDALARYAKQVIGIEIDLELAEFVANKGYKVYAQDSFVEPLPNADVYYAWTRDALGVYLKAKLEGTKGTFIFGPSTRTSLVNFFKTLDCEVRELGDWKIYITKL